MDGFFRSREFLVAILLVTGVAAGSAVASLAWGDAPALTVQRSGGTCATPPASGAPLETDRAVEDATARREREGWRAERSLTFAADAKGLQGGRLSVCALVGDVKVGTGSGSEARVEFQVRAHARSEARAQEIAAAIEPFARLAKDRGSLVLAAGPGEGPRLSNGEGVSVSVLLQVPSSGAYAVTLASGVGDVGLGDLVASRVDARTGVGDVEVSDVELEGNLRAEASTGDVGVHLLSVGPGKLEAVAGTGSVQVALPPLRPDVGYDATAETGVGNARVALPKAKVEHEDRGPGARAHGRTEGFDSKPSQVVVLANAGVGDVGVEVRS